MVQTRRQSTQPRQSSVEPQIKLDPEVSFEAGKSPIIFEDEEVMRLQNELASHPAQHMGSSQKHATKPPSRKTLSWFSVFSLAALAYITLLKCPSDALICRPINHLNAGRQLLTSKLDNLGQPYFSQLDPYLSPIYPYATQVDAHIEKLKTAYNSHVHPKILDTAEPYSRKIEQEYNRLAKPHVDHYSKIANNLYDLNVSPRLDVLSEEYNRHLPRLTSFYQGPLQTSLKRSYSLSQQVYAHYLRPQAINLWNLLMKLLPSLKILPQQVVRFHSLYIQPQVDRVFEKVFEYRTHKFATQVKKELEEQVAVKDEEDKELNDFIEELEAQVVVPPPDDPHGAVIEPPNTPEQDAEREAALHQAKQEKTKRERQRIEDLHAQFDLDIAKLGEKEEALLREKLTSIRVSALDDVDYRFDGKLLELESDSKKYAIKLAKYFDKLAKKQAALEPNTRMEHYERDTSALIEKALMKYTPKVEECLDDLEDYKKGVVARLDKAVEKTFESLQSLVGLAQEKLGHEYAWLDDVAVKDWTRYHKFASVEKEWLAKYRSLALTGEEKALDDKLAKKESQATALLDTFEEQLLDIQKTRLAAMKPPNVVVKRFEDAAEDVQSSVASVTEQIKESAAQVTDSVHSALGGTPLPSDIQGSASSLLKEATDSASSLASQAGSVFEQATHSAPDVLKQITDSASVLVQEASETASRMSRSIGSVPPEVNLDTNAIASSASSLASDASTQGKSASSILAKSASSLLQEAGSNLHFATKSVQSVVGGTPSPKNVADRILSLYTSATEELTDKAEALSSVVHDNTQSIKKAVGISPAPERLSETLSSAYQAASTRASEVFDEASSELKAESSAVKGQAASVSSDVTAILHAAPTSASSLLSSVFPVEGDFRSSASSISNLASSLAQEASANLHSATRSAASVVGLSVTPEGVKEHVESLAAKIIPTNVHEAYSSATAQARRHVDL